MKGMFFIWRKDIKNAAQQTQEICCAAFFSIYCFIMKQSVISGQRQNTFIFLPVIHFPGILRHL